MRINVKDVVADDDLMIDRQTDERVGGWMRDYANLLLYISDQIKRGTMDTNCLLEDQKTFSFGVHPKLSQLNGAHELIGKYK